jgi:hypothetical protein
MSHKRGRATSFLYYTITSLLLGIGVGCDDVFWPEYGYQYEIAKIDGRSAAALEMAFNVKFVLSIQFRKAVLIRGKDQVLLMKIDIPKDKVSEFFQGSLNQYRDIAPERLMMHPNNVQWWEPDKYMIKRVMTSSGLRPRKEGIQQIIICEGEYDRLVVFIIKGGGMPKEVYELFNTR